MHELALMESVVEEVVAHTGDAQVAVVRLEIGQLAGVATHALRFCFEICVHGTRLAGASLDIIEVPARARCRACGGERAIESLVSPCGCGSFDQHLLSGCELRLKNVEVI